MSSNKFSHKHEIYDLIKSFFGEGLITASGIILVQFYFISSISLLHKEYRRIIQPYFNLEFSVECIEIFEKHVKIFTK